MIDDLELTDAHADAIVDKGIEYDVFSDDKPESKKDIMEAAHNIVSLAIDAWVDDEVRPNSDDKDVAAAGKQVEEILELAGVTIDKKNNVEYGELPELEGAEAGDDDDDDGEAAFDINDVIEGYEELTAASKVKKIKELELDVEDEDDAAKMIAIAQWEMAQDSPSSRVLNYLGEFLDLEGSDDDDAAGDGESAGDDGEPEGEGGDYSEEPWEGYDKAKVTDIKKTLTEAAENEDEEERLTAEQVEYVIGYEEANKNRDGLLKWLRDIIDESGSDDDDDDGAEPEAEEEKPAKSKSKAKKTDDEDFEADDDDIPSMVPTGLARAFVESKLHEERIRQSGLTPPGDWEGDVPELPDDIGTVDHDELSNLMLKFQAALATASWHASMGYIRADIMEDIADYLEQRAILGSEESNDTKRKAEAKTEPRVVFFRGQQKTAYHDYVRYRDLARDFDGKIKVISRVGGFKDEEHGGEDARVQSAGSSKGTAKASGKGDAKPKVGRVSIKK